MNDPKTLDRTHRPEAGKDSTNTPPHQEENLEAGLEDSMDASDPPAATARGDHGDPVPSSGFPEDAEDNGESSRES